VRENDLLRLIRARRSAVRFKDRPVSLENVELILEAGRWAPSYINSQPWEFIVLRAARLRTRVAEILRRLTMSWQVFAQAPVLIIVAVDSRTDPRHHLQDGAAAAQNMALMAQSLGLASLWVAVYAEENTRGTAEDELRDLLRVPRSLRLVVAMPIGVPAALAESSRRPLSEMIHEDGYSNSHGPAGRRAGAQTTAPSRTTPRNTAEVLHSVAQGKNDGRTHGGGSAEDRGDSR
jgi:nitroreductase